MTQRQALEYRIAGLEAILTRHPNHPEAELIMWGIAYTMQRLFTCMSRWS